MVRLRKSLPILQRSVARCRGGVLQILRPAIAELDCSHSRRAFRIAGPDRSPGIFVRVAIAAFDGSRHQVSSCLCVCSSHAANPFPESRGELAGRRPNCQRGDVPRKPFDGASDKSPSRHQQPGRDPPRKPDPRIAIFDRTPLLQRGAACRRRREDPAEPYGPENTRKGLSCERLGDAPASLPRPGIHWEPRWILD